MPRPVTEADLNERAANMGLLSIPDPFVNTGPSLPRWPWRGAFAKRGTTQQTTSANDSRHDAAQTGADPHPCDQQPTSTPDSGLEQTDRLRGFVAGVYQLGVDAGRRLEQASYVQAWRNGVLCGLVPGALLAVAAIRLGWWIGG
jgi:hypothetical protein